MDDFLAKMQIFYRWLRGTPGHDILTADLPHHPGKLQVPFVFLHEPGPPVAGYKTEFFSPT